MFNKFIKTFFMTLFIATGVLAQTLITDNLGNHKAIKPLNMNNFSIQNISTNAFYFNDGSSLTIDENQQIVVKDLNGFETFNSGSISVDSTSISNEDSSSVIYDTAGNAGTNTIIIDGSPRVHITANGIIPEGNEVFDLGTAENKFRDLYLSASTIYLGDNKISYNADASSLTVVSSDNVTNTFLNDGYVFPENSDFAGALTNATLKTGTVGSDQIGEQSVGNYNILNKSITLDKLVDSAFERDVRKSSGSLINRGLWGAYIIGAGSEINGFPPTQSDNNRVLKYNHSSGSSTGYWTLVTLDSLTLDPDAMLKSEYDNRDPLHGTNGIVDYAEGLKNTTNYYDLGTVKWYKPANTNDGQVPVYSHTDGELRWIDLAGGGDMLKNVYDANETNAPFYSKIPNVVDVAETFINWPYLSTNKINVVRPQVSGDDSGKFLRFYWNSAANTYTTGLEEISTTLNDPEGSVVMLKANYLDQADKILLEKIPDGYLGSKIASKTITSNQIANNTLVSTNFNPEFLNTMIFKDTSFGKDESGPDSDLVGNHISGIRVVGLSGKDLPIPTENDGNKVLAYDALNQNWKLAAVDIEGGGAATVPYPSNAFPTDGNGEPVQSIIGSPDGVSILWYTNFASSGGGSGGISSFEPEIIHAQIFARNDADPQASGLNFKQHDSYTAGSTNGVFITYEGSNRINLTTGILYNDNNRSLDWRTRTLYNNWNVPGLLAVGELEISGTFNANDENIESVNTLDAATITSQTFIVPADGFLGKIIFGNTLEANADGIWLDPDTGNDIIDFFNRILSESDNKKWKVNQIATSNNEIVNYSTATNLIFNKTGIHNYTVEYTVEPSTSEDVIYLGQFDTNNVLLTRSYNPNGYTGVRLIDPDDNIHAVEIVLEDAIARFENNFDTEFRSATIDTWNYNQGVNDYVEFITSDFKVGKDGGHISLSKEGINWGTWGNGLFLSLGENGLVRDSGGNESISLGGRELYGEWVIGDVFRIDTLGDDFYNDVETGIIRMTYGLSVDPSGNGIHGIQTGVDATNDPQVVNYRTMTNYIENLQQNTVYPYTANETVSGEWNIDLVTHSNKVALYYEIVGTVTSVNIIANNDGIGFADITFYSGSNPITWISSSGDEDINWTSGSTPTQSTTSTNIVMIRTQSGKTYASYIGNLE